MKESTAQKVSNMIRRNKYTTLLNGIEVTLPELCRRHGAICELGIDGHSWLQGLISDRFESTPLRYKFPDGSAIIESDKGWTVEREA